MEKKTWIRRHWADLIFIAMFLVSLAALLHVMQWAINCESCVEQGFCERPIYYDFIDNMTFYINESIEEVISSDASLSSSG